MRCKSNTSVRSLFVCLNGTVVVILSDRYSDIGVSVSSVFSVILIGKKKRDYWDPGRNSNILASQIQD